MKIAGYILLFLLGAAACFFLMRGCNGQSADQIIQDSLTQEKKVNDSIKEENYHLAVANEVVTVNNNLKEARYQQRIDSQSHVIAILKGQLRDTTNNVFTSYLNLKKYYDEHDTVALATTYSNLATQLHDANSLLFEVSLARDSADHIRNDEITRSHAVIDTLQSEITQFKGLLTDCTNTNEALYAAGEKALKKSKINSLLAKFGGGVAALLAVLLLVK